MDIIINATIDAAPEGSVPIPAQGNYYHHLLACLGYPVDAPPVADLLRRYHGLDGTWLVASPIHWQATHNDAMIVACNASLDLSDEESRHWFDAWAAYLPPDEFNLHYHDAYTWLIQPMKPHPMHALPVHTLLHQPMMQHLKALDTSLFWSSLLTENQMLFSSHPLNDARKDAYPINGVWIWGAGQLAAPVSRPIVCGDEASCHLARVVSTHVRLYALSQAYSKNTIVLSVTDEPFKNHTARRYWNNLAYMNKASCRFIRFWRSLIEH
ncbi:MAG TPA: hypothetical protein DDY37_00995 [Legionella sp.]|nr:hypothetical protein [Legionella sp.]